jgi:hypothetical protein
MLKILSLPMPAEKKKKKLVEEEELGADAEEESPSNNTLGILGMLQNEIPLAEKDKEEEALKKKKKALQEY